MVKVYVDESGNMGKSGDYFVLAAIVFTSDKAEARVRRLIKKEQLLGANGKPTGAKKSELKFAKLEFEQKQRILNKISKEEGVNLFYFVAYKPMVELLQEGKTKNLVYNYFSKLLMSKIFKRYDDDFEIVFDQRSTAVKSMNSLTDYIEISAYAEFPNLVGKRILVNQGDSKTNKLLQAADLVAGAARQAYSLHNLHFLEILGGKIMAIVEFPKRGFRGSLKFEIGKRRLVDKLRGYS
ncbi:DUF3800 domain-containing protein [Candidatus Saccharibacteria bacterium]|nr:DUF3800 domain-containing protein [Candidatus Saccharibacteria bacterium]